MFIQIDPTSKQVVGVIKIGGFPSETNIEFSADDIPDHVLRDIFQYKYIDGEFVKNEDIGDAILEKIKAAKIAALSEICNQVIESGVDFQGEHYALTQVDQINLMQLSSLAKLNPNQTLPYHADGKLCHQYTTEEIITLAQISIEWVTFHTTYFNFMKAQINSLTSIDDVLQIQYGSPLTGEYMTGMLGIIPTGPTELNPAVPDTSDYSAILNRVNINDPLLYQQCTTEEVSHVLVLDDDPHEESDTSTEEEIELPEYSSGYYDTTEHAEQPEESEQIPYDPSIE